MSSLDMLLSAIRRWISSVTDSKDVIFDCWSPTREWRTKISRTQNKNAVNKVIIVTKSAANIHRGKTTTWLWLFCIMMALEVLLLSKKPTLQCLQPQRLNFFLRTRSHVICIAIQSPWSDSRHQTSCRSLIPRPPLFPSVSSRIESSNNGYGFKNILWNIKNSRYSYHLGYHCQSLVAIYFSLAWKVRTGHSRNKMIFKKNINIKLVS